MLSRESIASPKKADPAERVQASRGIADRVPEDTSRGPKRDVLVHFRRKRTEEHALGTNRRAFCDGASLILGVARSVPLRRMEATGGIWFLDFTRRVRSANVVYVASSGLTDYAACLLGPSAFDSACSSWISAKRKSGCNPHQSR